MDKHGKAAVQIRLSFYGIPTARHFQPCYLLAAFSCVFFRLLPIRFEVTQEPSLTLRNRLHTETVTCFIAGQSILLLSSQWALFILPLPRPTARSSCVFLNWSFSTTLTFLFEHRMDGVPIISDTVRQRCGRCHFCPRCSLPARGYVLAVVNFQVQLFFFREFAVCLN